MHVVSLKKLREFWQRHAASEPAIRTWYHEACHASWKSFTEIKEQHRSADCLPGNRVVFDIKGNHTDSSQKSITTPVAFLSGSSEHTPNTTKSTRRPSNETEAH